MAEAHRRDRHATRWAVRSAPSFEADGLREERGSGFFNLHAGFRSSVAPGSYIFQRASFPRPMSSCNPGSCLGWFRMPSARLFWNASDAFSISAATAISFPLRASSSSVIMRPVLEPRSYYFSGWPRNVEAQHGRIRCEAFFSLQGRVPQFEMTWARLRRPPRRDRVGRTPWRARRAG